MQEVIELLRLHSTRCNPISMQTTYGKVSGFVEGLVLGMFGFSGVGFRESFFSAL